MQDENLIVSLQGKLDVEVKDIVYHSKNVKPGSMFVCIDGTACDGHEFAEDAVRKGAVVVVCSKPLSLKDEIVQIRVIDGRIALAVLASAFYDYPAERLRVIGITGTKGKTSTSYMIHQIFARAGIKSGLIGTVEIYTGNRRISSSQTTPESLELQAYLREMVDAGCQFAVMEVSSQALKLGRVHGIHFDLAILTNVEADHIGPREHPDFEDYVACKAKLFAQCEVGVLNKDAEFSSEVMENHRCTKVLTYGFSPEADLTAEISDYVRTKGNFAVEFQTKGRYNINLVVGSAGEFSVSNALAAMLAAKHFGVSDEDVACGLKNFAAPGRQEVIPLGYDKVVLVDYAHNGMALSALLKGLRAYDPARLTCVFGCGGERDPHRRYDMGEVAAKYADYSIITSDNPRNESPTAIISDIIVRMEDYGGNYCVIEDRKAAIDFAIRHCIAGEIIVVAGKGHENYQIIGNQKLHFDDREIVRASIEKVNHEQNNNRRSEKSD